MNDPVGNVEGVQHTNQPMYHATARARSKNNAKIVGPLILLFGLILALLTVMFVPMLVSGTEPTSSRPVRVSDARDYGFEAREMSSVEDAASLLEFTPKVPGELPEGYVLQGIRVVDGAVLEVECSKDGQAVIYRTARGNQDLSGDNNEYAFTSTEEVGGVTRSYAGATEDKLNLAVWADGSYSFAVVAPGGVNAADLKAVAENIA